MINFITKTSLLSKKVMEAPRYVQKLRTNDIFLVYEQFDKFITFIMNMFENREFCKKTRLFQNFVYMLFLDLIKIYNVFYIMTTEILDRFKRMSHKEMEKAFAMYKNFINFTTSVKKEANTIPLHFGFVFKAPNYYTPDPKLENSLKRCMEQKEAGVSGYADEDLEGFDIPKEHNFADYDDDYENRKQFQDDDDDSDDEDLDVDILADVKRAEEFATASQPSRASSMAGEEEKINIDQFNTAALDDLLGNAISDTMGRDPQPADDVFAGENQYSQSTPSDGNDLMNMGGMSFPDEQPQPVAKAEGTTLDDIFNEPQPTEPSTA